MVILERIGSSVKIESRQKLVNSSLSSNLEPPLKQACIAMMRTIFERHNHVSHCLVYSHVKVIRRCQAHLMHSCISFSPHMIDGHLKDHLYQYRVKLVKSVSLNHIKGVCPVRICSRSKKPSHQSFPDRKWVRTSENRWSLVSSRSTHSPQPWIITQLLIMSPVESLLNTSSQVMNA